MEDKKDSTNKVKRYKSDQVKQALNVYLQKRNYPPIIYNNVTPEELELCDRIESAVSSPNSILYSCINNDPMVIDHTFAKFITWTKDLHKTEADTQDLDTIIGPLFCHLYLEILRGGHTEKAANFFKAYLSLIDRNKCEDSVRNFMNAVVNDSPDLKQIKEDFKCNKYLISLCTNSISILKKFLSEHGHIILLQIFQSRFYINEVVEEEIIEETDEAMEQRVMCNGFSNHDVHEDDDVQSILDVISDLKTEIMPLFTVQLNNIKGDVSCGLISRENEIAAYSYNNSIYLRSLYTLKQIPGTDICGEVVLRSHFDRIYDMSIISTYNLLLSASEDKTMRLFDLNDFSLKTTYRGHEYPVYRVATSCNGHYIVSGSYDHTARLWSTNRSDTLRVYAGHYQEITSIDFHPGSLYFLTGSADKSIRMWTLKDAATIRLFAGSGGTIYSLRFSPSSSYTPQYFVSAGDDNKLRIWDLVAGKMLVEVKTGTEVITKIAISDDSKICLTGSVDGNIKYWDFDSIIKTASDSGGHDFFQYASLNARLLSLEYSCDTFASLTTTLES